MNIDHYKKTFEKEIDPESNSFKWAKRNYTLAKEAFERGKSRGWTGKVPTIYPFFVKDSYGKTFGPMLVADELEWIGFCNKKPLLDWKFFG